MQRQQRYETKKRNWNRLCLKFTQLTVSFMSSTYLLQSNSVITNSSGPDIFVRYNRVNLCTKMTNLALKSVRYNRVRYNQVSLYLKIDYLKFSKVLRNMFAIKSFLEVKYPIWGLQKTRSEIIVQVKAQTISLKSIILDRKVSHTVL